MEALCQKFRVRMSRFSILRVARWAGLAFHRGERAARQTVPQYLGRHAGLVCVLIAALWVRLWLLRWWDTFPFGDVFNFVRIAQELAHGNYPVDEKRMPFYPLLILLVHSVSRGLRWETAAIGIAITSSLVVLLLLYALGRTLRVRKTALLVILLLVSSFPPFLSYAIRGYADTTFLALVLGALLTALRTRSARGGALTGVLLGLTILTRTEGALVAAALGIALLVRWRSTPRVVLAALIAGVLTVLPYVGLAGSTGRSLLPTVYLEEARIDSVYGAASLTELGERLSRLWTRLGLFEAWRTPIAILRTLRTDVYGLPRQLSDLLREPRSATALLVIPGFLFLLVRRRIRDVLLVVLPFAVLSLAIAWYATYGRYDALVYPLMAFLAGVGVHAGTAVLRRATVGGPWGWVLRRGLGGALLFVAVFVWFFGFTQETQESLKKSRFRELAYYRAVHAARVFPGVVAFEERRAVVEAYFGDRAVYADEFFFPGVDARGRWRASRSADVAVVVAQPRRPSAFAFLASPPPGVRVEETARFTVEQGNHDIDEAVVYRVLADDRFF